MNTEKNKKEIIYNLSTHYCDIEGVEQEPRLALLQNIKNTQEVIDKIKEGIKGVPKDAKVLVGGNNQFVGILLSIAKNMRWKVFYYSPQDNSIFSAAYLSRQDRLEIEKIVMEGNKENARI